MNFWTLPNLLTLSRLPMAALVWIRPGDPVYVLGLMALAGITDVLDGWVARHHRGGAEAPQHSTGAWLDPVCDKVFVLSVLVAVTVAHRLPLWLIPLIATREILQTAVVAGARIVPYLRRRLRPRFRANLLGKGVTVVQFLTVASILLGGPAQIPLAIASGVLGLVAVTVYVLRALGYF